MAAIRHLSTAIALALHAAGIGIAMSMPSGAPPPEPREIPITLTLPPPPAPPAPKVEEPKPKPEPKPVVKEAPPPPPEPPPPVFEPPPAVIASAATSTAQSVIPETPPPPPPPPPPNPANTQATDNYNARLQAWLLRHHRYPSQARSQRLEGSPLVQFTIDRTGKALDIRLYKSCGTPMLDDDAVKLVRRSSPFPAVPDDIPGETLVKIIPVEYFIKGRR